MLFQSGLKVLGTCSIVVTSLARNWSRLGTCESNSPAFETGGSETAAAVAAAYAALDAENGMVC